MPFIENAEEFTARQRCVWARDDRGNVWFRNGALIAVHGQRFDPPEDKAQLLRNRLRYYDARITALEARIENQKRCLQAQALIGRTPYGPPPAEEDFERVKHDKEFVATLRLKRQMTLDELKAIPGQSAFDSFVEDQERRKREGNRLLARAERL